jgi:FtsZ-interacting cell division protein ZipA
MPNQTDKLLVGDWVFLGMHVPHWLVVLAAIALVALLVAWFERPRSSSKPRTSRRYEASMLSERSASRSS